MLKNSFAAMGALLAAAGACAVRAEPAPGDVFREYTYGRRFGEVDPEAKRPGPQVAAMRAAGMGERVLELPSLSGVARAEVSVEYWGGHIGTSGQKFQVNGGEWIEIEQPVGTTGRPQCYYRTLLGRATVPVALQQLKAGRNVFRFTAGPQLCYSFDWGFYWVYSFTVRLYYDPETKPGARVVSPAAGSEIGDHPRLAVEARNAHEPITRVEFLGHYEDFNWEGDGEFRQWHYITERGALARHIGTAAAPPYAVTWDTTWVPDQEQPVRIAARVTSLSGLIYMTPEVSVRFRREGRSVRMYKTSDAPEAFGVRVGRKKECRIPVTGPLQNARAARLVLSTWSAAHGDEIGLNGAKLAGPIGLIHNYSFDALPVPRRLLRSGDNVFHIFSNTKEHALEVNWPGPVLLVEYGPSAAKEAPWADAQRAFRIPLEVNAAGYVRDGKPVEAVLKWGQPPDPASLRVVEVAADGAVADGNVPFQLDPGGELVWLLKGRTGPHTTRRYHVYFNGGRGGTAGSAPAMAVTDGVEFEGQPSLRIATPAAVYTYHKEGAGFASIVDREGVEWIGYHPGGRAAGEFRGIPNLGNDFGHPGHKGESGSVSRVESRGPLRVRIHSQRRDGKWAARWDIYPGYARLTMLRNDKPYWFLYEGTPGGKLDLKEGFLLLANGARMPLTESWNGDMPGPEWIAFGGNGSKRVLYAVNHQDDDLPDQYYPMDGEMTVFGFAREYRCCRQYFEGAPAEFTIGFAEAVAYGEVAEAADSAWRPLRVSVKEIERRPPGSRNRLY